VHKVKKISYNDAKKSQRILQLSFQTNCKGEIISFATLASLRFQCLQKYSLPQRREAAKEVTSDYVKKENFLNATPSGNFLAGVDKNTFSFSLRPCAFAVKKSLTQQIPSS